MDAVGNALDNICSTIELAVPTYWCCANSENAQMDCYNTQVPNPTPTNPANTINLAERLGLTDGGGVGRCDNTNTNNNICKPNGVF